MTTAFATKPGATQADLVAALAKIAQLEAKLAAKRTITFKIGEKGGVSVYGLGRFPVTLYASQWDALIAKVPELTAFIEANRDKLAEKE